jgi:predicted AAA+ superfamily ATPase
MFSRHLVNAITESQADTPVLLLHGARQTGKSTLMRALAGGDARYLSLDDASLLSALRADPAGYLAANPGRLLIDEVQRAPDVFLAIKHEVDLARMARKPVNGRFLLSGSANVLLLPRLADSLAGRMEVHTLWPLSQSEVRGSPGRVAVNFLDAVFAPEPPAAAHNGVRGPIDIDAMGRDELITQLLTGGYPEVVARSSEKRRKAWFDAYLHTIVQRDIRDLAQIDGAWQLPQLLRALAHKATGTLNTADLSRTLGIAQTTLRRYLQLLETVFLLTPLPAWAPRESHRAQKSPKLFFNDSGLLAHLLGLSAQQLASAPGLPGALLETFVHAELQKLRGWADIPCELMHYRTASGMEVDFILQDRQGRVVGVEVKSATQARADDFRGLRHLREVLGAQFYRGIVLHPGTQSVAFDPQLASVPVSALWASARSDAAPEPPM